MAEIILGSVVESITGHLLSLISDEIGLACSVRQELENLRGTVSIIGGVLREAEKRQVETEDLKEWLKSLGDGAYDADDLLEDFSAEALRHGRGMGGYKRIANKVCIFLSSSNQLIYANKMAHGVMEIKGKIDSIANDRVRFQLEGSSNHLGSLVENRVRPETYPSELEPYVIGRDEDKKEVIDFLLDPDFEENVSILPIVGFGGMGKTTLARLAFNDESESEYFELKIWICVSTNFNVEDILSKTIRKCGTNKQLDNVNMNQSAVKDTRNLNEELAKLDMNELQKKLREQLDGKRFFIVLDDVWKDNRIEWLKLQDSLTSGAKGSKILVTTHSPRVAKMMAATFHQLSGLPEKESLSLLMRMAMKQEHEWRGQNLERIALDILKKCVGVPLAIMTIGRLLLFLNTEEDWSNFMSNDLSIINQEEGDIIPSLKLSYDFLPSHLKQCFSYGSLFPKDHELDPFDLIHLWMTQGFIKSSGNRKTLEEVGQEYFMELVSRSFFQDLKKDVYGNIAGCKMHDLMYDLAMLVAGDNCIIINGSRDGRIPEEARHVSMVDVEGDELKLFELNQRIRSLLLINKEQIRWSRLLTNKTQRTSSLHRWIGTSLNISCLRNLRALCLLNVHVDVSGLIGKLKNLRSLDLSGNDKLRSLPNSISRLCNLETLNLRRCTNLGSLPRGITKLINLRQLDVSECYKLRHMPRGIGNLTSLQMLSPFVVGEKGDPDAARLNELGKLVGLRRELATRNLGRLGSISSEVDASFSIENFGLQSLKLHWRYNEWVHRAEHEEALKRLRPHPDLKRLSVCHYNGAKLSSWISQLHKLVEIEIHHCNHCKHLPSLHHLPYLKRISLCYMYNLEWIELWESETTQQSFFPSLKVLELQCLQNFKGWK